MESWRKMDFGLLIKWTERELDKNHVVTSWLSLEKWPEWTLAKWTNQKPGETRVMSVTWTSGSGWNRSVRLVGETEVVVLSRGGSSYLRSLLPPRGVAPRKRDWRHRPASRGVLSYQAFSPRFAGTDKRDAEEAWLKVTSPRSGACSLIRHSRPASRGQINGREESAKFTYADFGLFIKWTNQKLQ